MSAAKNSRLQLEKKETLGLLANGVSGSWEVAIDETSSGPDRWFAHIEGPTVCFSKKVFKRNQQIRTQATLFPTNSIEISSLQEQCEKTLR